MCSTCAPTFLTSTTCTCRTLSARSRLEAGLLGKSTKDATRAGTTDSKEWQEKFFSVWWIMLFSNRRCSVHVHVIKCWKVKKMLPPGRWQLRGTALNQGSWSQRWRCFVERYVFRRTVTWLWEDIFSSWRSITIEFESITLPGVNPHLPGLSICHQAVGSMSWSIHPYKRITARAYSTFQDPSQFAIVTEFLSGGSLFSVLHEHRSKQ